MMNFAALNPDAVTVGQSGIYALLGYAVVFFGLILLMVVVIILGKIFMAVAKHKQAKKPVAVEEVAVALDLPPMPTAPGAAGQLKLHDVEPKTAAMLMAIVADKLGKPLNELRFISIKEVK